MHRTLHNMYRSWLKAHGFHSPFSFFRANGTFSFLSISRVSRVPPGLRLDPAPRAARPGGERPDGTRPASARLALRFSLSLLYLPLFTVLKSAFTLKYHLQHAPLCEAGEPSRVPRRVLPEPPLGHTPDRTAPRSPLISPCGRHSRERHGFHSGGATPRVASHEHNTTPWRSLGKCCPPSSSPQVSSDPHPRCCRYGGAYTPTAAEAEDCKGAIEAKCHPKCTAVWDIYKACEARIEEKVRQTSRTLRPHWPQAARRAHERRSFVLSGHGQLRWLLHGLLQVSACHPRVASARSRLAVASRVLGAAAHASLRASVTRCIDKCAVKTLFKELA